MNFIFHIDIILNTLLCDVPRLSELFPVLLINFKNYSFRLKIIVSILILEFPS